MNPFKKSFFSKNNSTKRVLISLLFVVVVIFGAFTLGGQIIDKDGMLASVISKVLVSFTNEDRKTKNLNELTVNPLLEKAAEMKAKDMIAKGYFAHQSPEGLSPWYWLDKAGYEFTHAGENLAINFSESEDVNNAWLNSPKHKENIMNGNFTEVGIAVVDGMYEGKMTTFVVQFFGRPIKKAVTVKNQKTPIQSAVKVNNVKPKTKVSTTTTSDVLGANDRKILYLGVENIENLLEQNIKNPFWKYFIPVWF